VVAAREGKVAIVFDQSSKYYDGDDPKIGNSLVFEDTNFILVQHNDQTIAVYSHLAKGSHLVNMRQDIKAGQPLAKTGLSGWVGPTPHLHFQIYKAKDRKSVPFRFREYPGSLEHSELKKDVTSTS
jgi:murein DD-endopeptidase MepM/ murein hydrolase activator NlpD